MLHITNAKKVCRLLRKSCSKRNYCSFPTCGYIAKRRSFPPALFPFRHHCVCGFILDLSSSFPLIILAKIDHIIAGSGRQNRFWVRHISIIFNYKAFASESTISWDDYFNYSPWKMSQCLYLKQLHWNKKVKSAKKISLFYNF